MIDKLLILDAVIEVLMTRYRERVPYDHMMVSSNRADFKGIFE